MVILKAPADVSGASWRGTSFEVDAAGLIQVPEAAVAELQVHGFTVLTREVAAVVSGSPSVPLEIIQAHLAELAAKDEQNGLLKAQIKELTMQIADLDSQIAVLLQEVENQKVIAQANQAAAHAALAAAPVAADPAAPAEDAGEAKTEA